MAILTVCSASPNPVTVGNIPQISQTTLARKASSGTINKWSITHDLTLSSRPSKYQDYLTRESPLNDEFYNKHAKTLKDVRHEFNRVGEDPREGLLLVDAVQRLGIDYHFPEEIERVLNRQYMTLNNNRTHKHQDLYEVSLSFRLLRQQGYYVPADIFDNIMSRDERIKEKVGEDIKGLMALYEASQLSIQGEDILEEAAYFSSQLLNVMIRTFPNHRNAIIAKNTLKHPCHKSLARFKSKDFLKDFNDQNGYTHALLELAKMDFDIAQSRHQCELVQISRWWNELGLTKELKLARDQPLKWHMWSMAALDDPDLFNQRIELTKPISLIYIIDDIFDLYGTLDELTHFTEAVNRWDFDAIEPLPDYMKICFKALHDTTNEIGCKVYKEHGWNPIDYLRKAWGSLCDAFLVEAKWFALGHVPKAEDYLKIGVVTSGVHVALVHMFFLLGDGTNKERAELLNDHPVLISSVAAILRLWDDLGSAMDENQDGHDGSFAKCYMKEHQDTSVEFTRKHVRNMISEAWKGINKECLFQNPFSTTFTKGSLNIARMVPLMYNYDDNQGLPDLEKYINSMLYDRNSQ